MRYSLVLGLFLTGLFFCIPVISAQNANDLGSALAAAQEARKKAGDFEGNFYFPGEWEAAESQFAKAGLMLDDIANAIGAYNEAADAFNRIFELAVPLYAQAREDEIMETRDYLITQGAKELFPECLLDADRAALLALTQYEAKEYYPAKHSVAKALQKFNIMETAFNAWHLRLEILARGFADYDSDKFDLGGKIIRGAMEAYMAGDIDGAGKKAEEALAMYDMVLSSSWASYAELRASLAEGERLAALDMKTDIAAKEFFKIADSDNKKAASLLKAKKFEEAARLFIDAEAMYVIASITALEKKRAAAAAIKYAEEIIEESDEIVRNAGKNR